MTRHTDPDVDSESRFADVDRMRVHYRRTGTGTPVLLVHGSGSSSHGVEAVARLLSTSYDVIRPDLPGFGVTGPRPDGDYLVQTYAVTIAGFLDAIDVPRCVVVGNSLGGNIAWNLAVDDPDRVDALVLINATGYPEKSLPAAMAAAKNPDVAAALRNEIPRDAVEYSLRGAAGGGSTIVDDALVDLTHRLWNRPGNASAFVDFLGTVQPDRSAEIRAITVPTLVLRSADMDGQHFARDLAGSTERMHRTGGHLLPQEDPVWVADAITEFLRDRPSVDGEDS